MMKMFIQLLVIWAVSKKVARKGVLEVMYLYPTRLKQSSYATSSYFWEQMP